MMYKTWVSIKRRCGDRSNKNYGGRGVRLFWNRYEDFEKYVKINLGKRPSEGHSIDRIDVNRGYEPGNIRWADKSLQARNQRPRARATVSWKYKGDYEYYIN